MLHKLKNCQVCDKPTNFLIIGTDWKFYCVNHVPSGYKPISERKHELLSSKAIS